MTLYLDTSDLVKLYLDEPGADAIHDLVVRADVVATSVLAYPEARATVARRRRERLLTSGEAAAVIAALDDDWRRLVTMPFTDDLARAAGQLADIHRLRGGDAVHLATFQDLVSTSDDDDVRFSSADERLVRAARALDREVRG